MLVPNEIRKFVVVVVAAICLPLASCKKAGSDAQSPNSDAERDGDPLVELEQLEREMDRLGLRSSADEDSIASGGAGEGAAMDGEAEQGAETEAPEEPAATEAAADRSPAPKGAEVQHCADVCDLSAAICNLETRICSLSSSHGDDPTYADACRRAGEDCDVADDECRRCGG